MTGKLIFDPRTERLAIQYSDGRIETLSCGQRLVVKQTTRVEYADDWYLVGLFGPGQIPENLEVSTDD